MDWSLGSFGDLRLDKKQGHLGRSYPSGNTQSGRDAGVCVGIPQNCWHVIGRKCLTGHESV